MKSSFAVRYNRNLGINKLLEDLNSALTSRPDMIMLGGGNPSHIPQAEKIFQKIIKSIGKNKTELSKMLGDYDGSSGNTASKEVLSQYLRKQCGWKVNSENIAFTNGSQTAFFILFNLFAGPTTHGNYKILLPLAPEYIGYTDVGLSENMFKTFKPSILKLPGNEFKYQIDFNTLKVSKDISAICVSRPTNPTGNVLTDTEIKQLYALAKTNRISLIVDSAYGLPFPNILFTNIKPVWDQNVVYVMSMSKLGLPGVRTGIIVADKKIIQAVSRVTAVMSLTPGRIGPTILKQLIMTKQIKSLSNMIIPKHYSSQTQNARDITHNLLQGLPYRIHKQEGSFFLWLWFPKMPITSYELYERLKKKGVIVVPGEYFFPGMDTITWKHKTECIRVSCTPSISLISKGLHIIANELRQIYQK